MLKHGWWLPGDHLPQAKAEDEALAYGRAEEAAALFRRKTIKPLRKKTLNALDKAAKALKQAGSFLADFAEASCRDPLDAENNALRLRRYESNTSKANKARDKARWLEVIRATKKDEALDRAANPDRYDGNRHRWFPWEYRSVEILREIEKLRQAIAAESHRDSQNGRPKKYARNHIARILDKPPEHRTARRITPGADDRAIAARLIQLGVESGPELMAVKRVRSHLVATAKQKAEPASGRKAPPKRV